MTTGSMMSSATSIPRQLMEDIELLDGAGTEFDMELVARRRAVSGILRLRPDQLRRGDLFGAFPADDDAAAAQKVG